MLDFFIKAGLIARENADTFSRKVDKDGCYIKFIDMTFE